MTNTGSDDAAAGFGPLRPKLMRVAYRMLGSVQDAEDIVQEAFIRWMRADRGVVREPEAFLRRTVTRLCLDQLKSARHLRETYVGPWLPDPVVEEDEVKDVTLPLMLVLERLSPLERAAFLLHDVFGLGFEEVAAAIERDAAACRQLAARARAHVREARPRFKVEKQRGLELAEAFFVASRSGNMKALGDVDGRRQRPCRWRRQASGSHRAGPGIRCRHDTIRACGGLVAHQWLETCPCRLHQRIAGVHYAGSRW
jgi:RNA polymerase sigma-70 factor (ECF subfamily)